MSETVVFDKIFAIHDQAVGTLRSLRIAPYPTQYKKYFDEIFIEQADAALRKAQKEAEAVDTNSSDLARYLDIAHRTLITFAETHADISAVAKLQEEYIQNASEQGIERCINFIDGLSALSDNMLSELEKAQSTINHLNTELKHAQEQLTTDPLTQITNRKGLLEDLEASIEAGKNKKLPLVMMMIDADDFKALNDFYGHLTGDKVLHFMAQSIKSLIRGGDKVYRYGGEEFIVLLNRCEHDQAFAVADKIRIKIEHSHLIYSGKTLQLTVSIGVTTHHEGDSFESFLERADQAMYHAKNEGKNKTVLID